VANLSVPRLVIVVAVGLVVLAAAVPVVAFGIVPLFVRSTVHEAAPSPGITVVPISEASAMPVASPTPSVVATGMLRKVDAVHHGSGQVSILDLAGARYLRFEGVAIAGAPNMYVYLSDRSDGRPGSFTDLGPLKATDGSFNYPLPDSLDLTGIHSVVVWCRAFSVTVTYAELARP
jgi:Electron transfer DM13